MDLDLEKLKNEALAAKSEPWARELIAEIERLRGYEKQRARMKARFDARQTTPATADFDLPAAGNQGADL